MDNPEEVLQALDEFQKMRPSEIPRELEEYLCFVAKTGDPVYQWSMIKALFREKLMRVMTEFYESCPTPDLTSCPNVEQFNYDIMKTNLLDRLETFSNAPFTVQRICELLTAPRKEYNRIDKFMRAIEKNILVVSTKDPGSLSRRSENGDSLVNGSVEDETSHHGLTSEVETWEKACAETAVLLQMGDNEQLTLERTDNAHLKNSFVKSENITALDGTSSTFITSTGDFSATTSQVLLSEVSAVVQNLTTVNHETNTTSIVGDVSEAMMNEDTSSQPSLELESDDSNSNDAKKLQTTFQAKDFNLDVSEPSKSYTEENHDPTSDENAESVDSKIDVNDQQSIQSYSSEELSNDSASDSQNSLNDKTEEPVTSETGNEIENKLDLISTENSESNSNTSGDNSQAVTNNDLDVQKEISGEDFSKTTVDTRTITDVIEEKNEAEQVQCEITESTPVTINATEKLEETCGDTETTVLSEVSKPIVEESPELTNISETITESESIKFTIQEEEEIGDNLKDKIITSEPLPTIIDSTNLELTTTPIVPAVISEVKNGLDNAPTKSEQPDRIDDNQMLITSCDETPTSKGITEWMDVDNEAVQPSTQDEPMDQEVVEALNS